VVNHVSWSAVRITSLLLKCFLGSALRLILPFESRNAAVDVELLTSESEPESFEPGGLRS